MPEKNWFCRHKKYIWLLINRTYRESERVSSNRVIGLSGVGNKRPIYETDGVFCIFINTLHILIKLTTEMSGWIKISANSQISARFESANVPVIRDVHVLNSRGRNFANSLVKPHHHKRVLVAWFFSQKGRDTYTWWIVIIKKTWCNYIERWVWVKVF